jgi:hypothetical protein
MQDYRHLPPGVAKRTRQQVQRTSIQVQLIHSTTMLAASLEGAIAHAITSEQVRRATSWGELNGRLLP